MESGRPRKRPGARATNLRRVSAATSDVSSSAAGEYTVDEVAELTRTTVRTIRWYQSEGLLPPPRRAGRVAMYDTEHLARLEAIRDLQEHGLTLTAIRRLLDRAPGSAGPTALAFVRTAVAQSVAPGGDVVTLAELGERLGLAAAEAADPAILEELGIARALPDGRWQITVPAAVEASARLARLGVPMDARIRLTRVFRDHTDAMARAVVALFLEFLWRPGESPEDDPDQWAALTEAVARLRPLGATAAASMFDYALARSAEETAERVLDPDASGGRPAERRD
jgi:DNA-binding transcriptional MerR regulator